ncbi:hypothetical protein [Blastococcus sp. TF02A-26]|uniref:hypothetical protein n=1 Tax=Blastococcus sp. TF02A-26 TaxID=2250577 RepID=UPI000DEB5D05|nr:hypothetical protein [Blastococcus sp. TF02A-26]RBY89904.1 hypothetical protein DQ240_03120 [Blastococcus sp. TF02A-26]
MLAGLVLVLMIGCSLAVWKDLVAQRSDGSVGRAEYAREATAATRRTLRSFLPRSRKPVLPREDRAPLAGRITCSDISDYVAGGYQGIVVHLMQADRRRRAA